MSQLGPIKVSEVKHTGNGADHSNGKHVHGGPVDGLPAAAPHANGNGAGLHAASIRAGANGDVTPATEVLPEALAHAEDPMLSTGDVSIGLSSVLESLLFVAGEAVEVSHLAKSLELPAEAIRAGLARLADQYKARAGGLRLQVHNGRYQLVTSPVTARFVEDFLNIDVSTKLSSAALETLAIVAYRRPATRAQIEAIRGVDCSGVLRSLAVRGLIEGVGRLDAVGRPIVYGVTELFMQHFGLTELDDLPPLAHEDADLLHAATTLAEEPDNSELAAEADGA